MSRNLRRPPSLGLNKPKPAAGSPKIGKEGLPPVAPSSGSRTRKPARVIDGRIHPGTEELNTRKVTDFYKFHRGEVLGEGISGKVYRAVNRSTGDPVAVKVIHYRSIPGVFRLPCCALRNRECNTHICVLMQTWTKFAVRWPWHARSPRKLHMWGSCLFLTPSSTGFDAQCMWSCRLPKAASCSIEL